jgi:hypothetical protein
MTAEPIIGDAEKLRELEQQRRNSLVAFAAFLTGHGTADGVLSALCPADVDWDRVKDCFADLLHVVDTRGADRTDLPFEGQVDLDYMTGARR